MREKDGTRETRIQAALFLLQLKKHFSYATTVRSIIRKMSVGQLAFAWPCFCKFLDGDHPTPEDITDASSRAHASRAAYALALWIRSMPRAMSSDDEKILVKAGRTGEFRRSDIK